MTIAFNTGIKKTFVVAFAMMAATVSHAQNFGLSFSYFIPKHGEFSTPISPFSVRGIGLDFNNYFAIETGASLYRMGGLNIKDLPFESKKSLLGPNFTILVPLELVLQFKGQKADFDLKAGGFFFHGFDQRINYGNMDRAIREFADVPVANADLSFKNHPGFGYHAGAELTVYVSSQFGISLETNYMVGSAKFPLTGLYLAPDSNGDIQSVPVDYKDAKVDFTGLEFSIGVIMTGGGGKAKPKAKKRKKR
jgi:hypothetical protein